MFGSIREAQGMKSRRSQDITEELCKEASTQKLIQLAEELLGALAAEDAERNRANDSDKSQAAYSGGKPPL